MARRGNCIPRRALQSRDGRIRTGDPSVPIYEELRGCAGHEPVPEEDLLPPDDVLRGEYGLSLLIDEIGHRRGQFVRLDSDVSDDDHADRKDDDEQLPPVFSLVHPLRDVHVSFPLLLLEFGRAEKKNRDLPAQVIGVAEKTA